MKVNEGAEDDKDKDKNKQTKNTQSLFFEKVMKALKMSIIHVLAFIVSWTPYTVMGTW